MGLWQEKGCTTAEVVTGHRRSGRWSSREHTKESRAQYQFGERGWDKGEKICFCSCCKPYGSGWPLLVCSPAREGTDHNMCFQTTLGFGIDIHHTKGMIWAARAELRLRQEAETEEKSLAQLEKRKRVWPDCGRRSQAAALQKSHVGLNAMRQIPLSVMFPSTLQ